MKVPNAILNEKKKLLKFFLSSDPILMHFMIFQNAFKNYLSPNLFELTIYLKKKK